MCLKHGIKLNSFPGKSFCFNYNTAASLQIGWQHDGRPKERLMQTIYCDVHFCLTQCCFTLRYCSKRVALQLISFSCSSKTEQTLLKHTLGWTRDLKLSIQDVTDVWNPGFKKLKKLPVAELVIYQDFRGSKSALNIKTQKARSSKRRVPTFQTAKPVCGQMECFLNFTWCRHDVSKWHNTSTQKLYRK